MLQIEEILPWSTKAFKELPYDLYCLSIQSVLLERICKKCNLYFASKVMLKKHKKVHKNDAVREVLTIARTRPVRIAAVRQREMMAIIAREENGEQVDWMDEDELDLAGIQVPKNPDSNERDLPIYSMEEHLSSPWENEEGSGPKKMFLSISYFFVNYKEFAIGFRVQIQ